jgi:hypothetical protein
MLLIKEKMRTAQSVLGAAQAKCEDLSEAIGKSISGLQAFKSKLDLIAKSNWRGKETINWENMVTSLEDLKWFQILGRKARPYLCKQWHC